MITIYQKGKNNKLVSAIEKPFQSEEELEKYIMSNTGILSDIFIINRRVISGSRKDIPDMVGVDRDNNIVVIENKNVNVNEDILPQILRYAIWAQTNPDSIKAMWLEAKNRPDDVEVDWDNVSVRIIVLAPTIKHSVIRLLNQINYRVELIEVKRYLLQGHEFVLLNRLEQEVEISKSARGLEIYNDEFYRKYRNNNSVDAFYAVINQIDRIVKSNHWNLEKKFNKHYVGYKMGFFNVFGLSWISAKSFIYFFKMSESQFKKIKRLCPYDLEYDDIWSQAYFKYSDKVNTKRFIPIFKKVFNYFLQKQ